MSVKTIETAHPRAAAVQYYRLAVLLLGVALAAMIAATVFLAVRPAESSDRTTSGSPGSPTQVVPVDRCFRPAVPC